MKHLYIYIFLFLLSCSGGGSSGVGLNTAVYYIDPSASINGNGTEGFPFKTFNGIAFESGAEYLIKRGTVLEEQITIDTSGKQGDPIIIGAYGTGADPVIDGSEIVNSWTSEGGSIYSNTLSPTAAIGRGNVTIDNVIQNFITGTPANGQYAIDSAGKVQIYGDPSLKTVKLSRRYFGIKGDNVSFITIENIHIKQASLHGIHFEDSDNINISNCKIEMCGGAFIGTLQAGNGIEFGNSSSNCAVTDCTIREIFDSGITPQTYDSNQSASGFTFTGNTISKCGFAGIEVAALYNDGNAANCSIVDVLIENNTISDCGEGWSGVRYNIEGRGIKINADISGMDNTRSISGVLIKQTTILSNAGEGVFISGECGTVQINQTKINNNGKSGVLFQEPASTQTKISLNSSVIFSNNEYGVSINTFSSNGFELYHNTFYNNISYDFVTAGTLAVSKLKNCLFHSTFTKVYIYTNGNFSEVFNNYFTIISGNIIGYNGAAYSTGVSFNNGSERFGNIDASDPLLTASLDISGATSPCYHAGISGTGVTTDFSSEAFHSLTPSIGAYEY